LDKKRDGEDVKRCTEEEDEEEEDEDEDEDDALRAWSFKSFGLVPLFG